MKKIFLALSFVIAIAAQGQIMQVSSVTPLQMKKSNETVMQAVAISPQGDYLLLSTDSKQGLIKWDFASGTSTTVTNEAGAGSDVCISDDGQQIVYSAVSYKDKRRQTAVKSHDLITGKKQTLVKPTRHQQGYMVQNSSAVTITDGKVKLHTLKKGATQAITRPVLSKYHLKLYITRNGETTMLAPNGPDKNYIWASLSPDGKRVLYYVSGHGTFVCDVDGDHVIAMGNLTAPKWWDDSTIVGMDETDDEFTIVSSAIIARTLDGKEQRLTDDDVIATNPLPSAQAGKIAFSTPNGNIYLISVE